MDPVTLGIIGAGASSLIGGLAQNAANRQEAQRNRDFQERMSSTAYQRATADMRLAGINPMLAYMQGGASSPSGSTATMQDVISPAVSSAQHARMLAEDIKLRREETNKVKLNSAMERGVMLTQGELNIQHTKEAKARTDLAQSDLPMRRERGRFFTQVGKGVDNVGNVMKRLFQGELIDTKVKDRLLKGLRSRQRKLNWRQR